MEDPPSYSTAVNQATMSSSSSASEKFKPLSAHPIFHLFILMNISLFAIYSGYWINEFGLAKGWKSEEHGCPFNAFDSPRDFKLRMTWSIFYIGQLCAITYIMAIDSAQYLISVSYVSSEDFGSQVKHIRGNINIAKMALVGCYLSIAITNVMILVLCSEFGACSALTKPFYPNLVELASLIMMSVFFVFLIILVRPEIKWIKKMESGIEQVRHYKEVINPTMSGSS